jgi:hypothetical protein
MSLGAFLGLAVLLIAMSRYEKKNRTRGRGG